MSTKCDEHSGHCEQLKDIDRLWLVVRGKAPLWALILLITLVLSGLGFNWQIYDAIKNVEKDVAVINATLKIKGP